MKLKKTLQRVSLVVQIVVIIGSAILIFSLMLGQRVQSSQAAQRVVSTLILPSTPEQTAMSAAYPETGYPVRLRIPKIKLDTVLEQVGLTPQGAVDAPQGITNAGWFKLGPRPGDIGNAIIDGHFGWKNGKPAIFNAIYTLRKGDKVYVEDEKGVMITFVVRALRTYGPNDAAPDVFISSDGKAHLNLITCQGIWNNTQKNYSKRLVVFTDKQIE